MSCKDPEGSKLGSSVVCGDYMERSLADFARACEVRILEEQEKISPDGALVALLCDAVRLTRECSLSDATSDATPWPLRDVLTLTLQWAKHLLDDHDCDHHGHEVLRAVLEAEDRRRSIVGGVGSDAYMTVSKREGR